MLLSTLRRLILVSRTRCFSARYHCYTLTVFSITPLLLLSSSIRLLQSLCIPLIYSSQLTKIQPYTSHHPSMLSPTSQHSLINTTTRKLITTVCITINHYSIADATVQSSIPRSPLSYSPRSSTARTTVSSYAPSYFNLYYNFSKPWLPHRECEQILDPIQRIFIASIKSSMGCI